MSTKSRVLIFATILLVAQGLRIPKSQVLGPPSDSSVEQASYDNTQLELECVLDMFATKDHGGKAKWHGSFLSIEPWLQTPRITSLVIDFMHNHYYRPEYRSSNGLLIRKLRACMGSVSNSNSTAFARACKESVDEAKQLFQASGPIHDMLHDVDGVLQHPENLPALYTIAKDNPSLVQVLALTTRKSKCNKKHHMGHNFTFVRRAECTDDTAADCGEAPGCCGFLTDAEGVERRVCSEDGMAATDGEEGTFSCSKPSLAAESLAAERLSAPSVMMMMTTIIIGLLLEMAF